jgi:MFS family permease
VSLTIPRSTVTAWRDLPGSVWLLVVARAVNRLGAFTLPFLSVTLVTELGASITQAGFLMAAFGVATIPSRLVGGRLADRWGTRATIAGGLVATAIAQLLVAGSRTMVQASVAVVLLGLAFELYEPPTQALVADATTPEDRPVAFGLLFAALSVAGMGAGLLAALLAGIDLRWLFVADAVTGLLCAAVVWWRLPRPVRTSGAPTPSPAQPWRDPRLLAMLGLGTVFAVVYLQVVVILPLTVSGRGLPLSTVGLLLAVAATATLLGQPLVSAPWLVRIDDTSAMAIGFLVLAVGLTLMGFATSVTWYVVATVVWSLGELVLMGRVYALVSGLAPAHGRGAYLAAYGTSWGVAAAAAPLLGTQLLARTGPVVTWACLAVISLALAAACVTRRRTSSDSRRADPLPNPQERRN